ncbi:MAG: hypothetical protein ACO23H_18820 [Alphaproteobacteria bacterium]|jgi:hypothetical protein
MARVDRTINPTVKVFPLEIPTQTVQQQSGFPRAVVDVSYTPQAVAAPGLNDFLQIYTTYTLPKNFAYIYLGYTISISNQIEGTIDDTYNPWHQINGDNGNTQVWVQQSENQPRPGPSVATNPGSYRRYDDPVTQYALVWNDPKPTQDVIFNTKSENVTVKSYLVNENTSGYTESFIYGYNARFLQVDLSQAYAFAINNTLATR